MKKYLLIIAGAAVIAACGPPEDPLQPMNKAVHGFNKAVDQALLRPASKAYGVVVKPDAQTYISNFGKNLNEPKNFVNNLLQGDGHGAMTNLSRFIFNSTFGIAGFGDPSSARGAFPDEAGFGQTLGVWGVPEGAYIELPLFGPSTVREAIGRAVDMGVDPLKYILDSDDIDEISKFKLLEILNTRALHGNLIDMVLYQSADSYQASRLAYLQNLRSNRQTAAEAESDEVELENFYDF